MPTLRQTREDLRTEAQAVSLGLQERRLRRSKRLPLQRDHKNDLREYELPADDLVRGHLSDDSIQEGYQRIADTSPDKERRLSHRLVHGHAHPSSDAGQGISETYGSRGVGRNLCRRER